MATRKPATFVVRRVDQLRALAGPVPHRIVSAMERAGPSTVGDIAPMLGMSPESLYYHVRRLRAAGILLEDSVRRGTTRPEVVYDLPGREMVIDPEARSPRVLSEIERITRALLRMAERTFGRALHSPLARRSGRGRNLLVAQRHVGLSRRSLAELNRRLEDLDSFLVESDDPSASAPHSVTVVVAPVV